jgi:hypothetical protein
MTAFIASTSNKVGMRNAVLSGWIEDFCTCETDQTSQLRFGSAQEKFDCISHPLGEFMRSGKIYGPLTHDRIE